MFNNIDVDFIFFVFDAFGAPGGDPGGLLGQLFEFLNIIHGFGFHTALLNVFLQQFRVGDLRDAVVANF